MLEELKAEEATKLKPVPATSDANDSRAANEMVSGS